MSDVKSEVDSDMESVTGGPDPKNMQELSNYVSVTQPKKVQALLQGVQDKFQNMSDQIISRIDDMGARIDDLEKSIGDLMNQAGVEQPLDSSNN